METPCWGVAIKQNDEAWCINGSAKNIEITYEFVRIFKGGAATVVCLSIEIWTVIRGIRVKNPDGSRLVDVDR